MKRTSYYLLLAVIVSLVNDGWSGRPGPLMHQVMLIPLELLFVVCLFRLLSKCRPVTVGPAVDLPIKSSLWVCFAFEVSSLLAFLYESRHFERFGYHLSWGAYSCVFAISVLAAATFVRFRSGMWLFVGALGCYVAGEIFSICCFPLNYLRSDMLPVVQWADQRLVHGLNPYTTMHVGNRLYDFPYLPGVLLAYLPGVRLGVDPRWTNVACVVVLALMLYKATLPRKRLITGALVAVFLLSPFLQYRHDLYLAPHWLLLVITVILLQKRSSSWAAVTFGLSMAVYQLSWVLWPFLLLHALRRRGWLGVLRTAVLSLLAMAVVIGPFLHAALKRIASNTVGQWSRLPHALAEPMNLSYWVTYLVRPDQLKWAQLAVLSLLFFYCLIKGRCRTVEDMLRWMGAALAIFIALNVLVDGYFYLTLLLLLLLYTLSGEGVWGNHEVDRDLEEFGMVTA